MVLVACGVLFWGVIVCLAFSAWRGLRPTPRELPALAVAVPPLALVLRCALDPSVNYTFVVDDAYYYLNIAWNTAESGVTTFDGIHPTNGWHPLWLCLLAALKWLAPVDREGFVLVAQLANWFLMVTAVPLLLTLLRPFAGPLAALVGVLLFFNPWAISRFWCGGMETPVVLVLMLAMLDRWRAGRPSAWGLGGLLILGRTDLALLVLALFLGSFVLRRTVAGGTAPCSWWRVLLTASPAALLPLLYIAWNYWQFGTVGTVSSYVKLAVRTMSPLARWDRFCLILPSLEFLLSREFLRFVVPILLVGAVLLAVYGVRRVDHRPSRLMLVVLGGFALVHYAATRLLIRESYSWYHPGESLLAALLAAALFELLASAWPKLRLGLAAGLAGILLLLTADMVREQPALFISRQLMREGRAAADFLRRETPPGTRIASWDAGILGYFSERPVINLDGLVNSWDFVAVMRSGEYGAYLDRLGVQFVANAFNPHPDGTLILRRAGMEALHPRLQVVRHGPFVPLLRATVAVVVFRLLPAPAGAGGEQKAVVLGLPARMVYLIDQRHGTGQL